MKTVAIIPARAGSKGVPRKNTRIVFGRPLMAWTIECALSVGGLDEIVVTSDGEDILDIARAYPRVLPHSRPAALATDTAAMVEVVRDVLRALENAGKGRFTRILLLQPTSPLRESFHISEAISLLTKDVSSVISVTSMRDLHPARLYGRDADGRLTSLAAEWEETRRQDLPPVYYRNGSIYLVDRDEFEAQGSLMAKPAVGYVMADKYLLNVDEPRDMVLADALIEAWQEGRL